MSRSLVLEVGHEQPRPGRGVDADGLLEADEEALLQQPPAQVVGDLQAGRDLQLGVDVAQLARGLLGVELDEALALLAEDAKRALRRAQRGPDEAVLGVDDAEVRQRLGRRVERAGGVDLGDLARHEAHLAAGGQAGDRLVGRVVDDRALDERPGQPGADDEHEERHDREGEEVGRRAHAACAGPRACSSCAASGAAAGRRRAAAGSAAARRSARSRRTSPGRARSAARATARRAPRPRAMSGPGFRDEVRRRTGAALYGLSRPETATAPTGVVGAVVTAAQAAGGARPGCRRACSQVGCGTIRM